MKLINRAMLLAALVLASNNVADAQSLVRGERSLQKKPDGPVGPAGPAPKGGDAVAKGGEKKDGLLGREESLAGPPGKAGSNGTAPIPPHLFNATDGSESATAPEAPLACLSALMENEDPTQIFVSNANLTSCVSSVYRPDPDGRDSHTTSLQEIADCLNDLFEC